MYNVTTETIVKTIPCLNGEIYSIIEGNRFLFAKCEMGIDIIEHSMSMKSCAKTWYTLSVSCSGMNFKRAPDDKFLSTVSSFSLSTKILRKNGIFKEFIINNAFLKFTNFEQWCFICEDCEAFMKEITKIYDL